MVAIPKQINLLKLIDSGSVKEKPRPHLGYSASGNPCKRALWYSFHWATYRSVPTRVQRIFNTGHIFEKFMTDSLKEAGITVYAEQLSIDGPHGHIKGHIDGMCLMIPGDPNTKDLLEMKTMNDRNFKDCIKRGVRFSKSAYYAQMQAYMGKLDLTKSLFMAYNKNTSEYYLEIIDFDKEYFKQIESKLLDVLYSEFPPEKIGPKTFFDCKYCDFYDICHKGAPIENNCRTCEHSNVEEKGAWSCSLTDEFLGEDEQFEGCSSWSKIETL